MIPLRLYLIGGALVSAFIAGFAAHTKLTSIRDTKAALAVQTQIRQMETDDAKRTIRALDNNALLQDRLAVAALADRSVVHSVQHRLASLPAACPADPAGSANDRDRTIRDLLGTCTALAAEGANLVDQLRGRAQALEALHP